MGAVQDEEGTDNAAREMYVSVIITHKSADRAVSLNGVTVAFDFSRRVLSATGAVETAATERFVFMCWGAQKFPAPTMDGGYRPVSCNNIKLSIDNVGPRVTFGDVTLQPGEFLAGGHSNFISSL